MSICVTVTWVGERPGRSAELPLGCVREGAARLLGDSCLRAGVPPLEAKVQVAPRPRRRESS